MGVHFVARRVGAIDIGTNSTRLLVAEVAGGRVRPLDTRVVTTRLGAGIGSGRLDPAAVRRTVEVLRGFGRVLRAKGALRVVAAATSAVRDAADRGAFVETVRRETGLAVRILSGAEEAALGYRGVAAGTAAGTGAVVMLDVGGGSTELVWMAGGGLRYRSVDVGAVRMTEQGAGAPVIRAALAPVTGEVGPQPGAELTGVGGTITTLAAMHQELAVYDPARVHGYRLTAADVGRLLADIRGKTPAALRRTPGLEPARADIIEAGACIVGVAMDLLGREHITVSMAGILHGLALAAADDVEIKPPSDPRK